MLLTNVQPWECELKPVWGARWDSPTAHPHSSGVCGPPRHRNSHLIFSECRAGPLSAIVPPAGNWCSLSLTTAATQLLPSSDWLLPPPGRSRTSCLVWSDVSVSVPGQSHHILPAVTASQQLSLPPFIHFHPPTVSSSQKQADLSHFPPSGPRRLLAVKTFPGAAETQKGQKCEVSGSHH